ncbi:hypothetical protein RCL1_008813 [Eukaryota sp. TZLM3-RCL]
MNSTKCTISLVKLYHENCEIFTKNNSSFCTQCTKFINFSTKRKHDEVCQKLIEANENDSLFELSDDLFLNTLNLISEDKSFYYQNKTTWFEVLSLIVDSNLSLEHKLKWLFIAPTLSVCNNIKVINNFKKSIILLKKAELVDFENFILSKRPIEVSATNHSIDKNFKLK